METGDGLLQFELSTISGEVVRVLLSAYACEPNKGSEPEIGWQRALHMQAHVDEVWVITRANNKAAIEADPLSRGSGLHFIYYDSPRWMQVLKRRSWFLPFYFVCWQWGAYRVAALHHREKRFDRVYHVTLSGMLPGSFMGRLGIPFIVGPVAGGERAPLRLRRSMPASCKIRELLRDLGIFLQRYSPLTTAAFSAAHRIYVTTPESLRLVQPRWHSRTQIHLSIAILGLAVERNLRVLPASPRFVFVGRLLHWKGVHFAIRALAVAKRTVPAATIALIGTGPDEPWLRCVAKKEGVIDAVEFAGHLPRQQLMASLQSYTALLFPSLHDSGGSAVLEALQRGVPVICLDLGGPGMMVDASCGIVVSTAHADEAQIVTNIANAMISLASMPVEESSLLSAGAIARANELSWARLTECIVE